MGEIMNLDTYLLQHRISPAEFARRIKVGRMAVHRYLRGERFPRPDVLARIHYVTAGQVTANDFVGTVTHWRQANTNNDMDQLLPDIVVEHMRYPWSRVSAEERRRADEAFAQMMTEPREGDTWSPAIKQAMQTLADRARFRGDQFQLDGRTVRATTLVIEANRLRQAKGLPLLRYPGVPDIEPQPETTPSL